MGQDVAKNKKILITGGSSGIGLAAAKAFAANENRVLIVDKIAPSWNAPKADFVQCELSDAEQVQSTINTILKKMQPEVMVFNAGQGIHEKLAEGDPEKWEKVFAVNVLSTLRFIRAFVPSMMKKKNGDIIFTSSVSATHPYTYGGVYAATKAAMNVIAETLRLETLPFIRVTVISPGVVDTPFFKNMISGSQTPESIGWGAISAEQIAELMRQVVATPKEVSINNIVVRPSGQPM